MVHRICLLLLLLLLSIPRAAAGLEPGDICPRFELPWLDGSGTARSPDLLAGQDLTIILLWSRGCPHCTDVALGVDRLAGALAGASVRVVPILSGPDNTQALRSLLDSEQVRTPHLWDAGGRVGAAFGLGLDHLLVAVVDSSGMTLRVFDDSIPDLESSLGPAIRELAGGSRPPGTNRDAAAGGSARSARSTLDGIRLDGRLRLQDAEGVQTGDRGLYGEALDPGALFLYRWDVRGSWEPVPGIEIVPWLRVSNEDDAVLTEGAEQLSSRWGSATLRWQAGGFSTILGAFPARLSPLLLQRWDARDAPPLGGTTGCAACGAGVAGISARSLEVLEAPYTFEGGSLSLGQAWVRAGVWASVARWEKELLRFSGVSLEDSLAARYRRFMVGGAIDLGSPGREDPVSGLPSPYGVRIGYLHVADDPHSLSEANIQPASEWREHGAVLQGRLSPGFGLAADVEHVWWRNRVVEAGVARPGQAEPGSDAHRGEARAYQAGIDGGWKRGRLFLRADLHRLRIEPEFEPLYTALTYEPNDEGWRLAGGVELRPRDGSPRPLLAVAGFLRATRDVRSRLPRYGDEKRRTESLSLSCRPLRGLLAQAHRVRTIVDSPHPAVLQQRRSGYSFDARWEGWSSLDPVLRLDAVRESGGPNPTHTIWQGSFFVRVVR